jgi:hypothetical protein
LTPPATARHAASARLIFMTIFIRANLSLGLRLFYG